jgi:hypothetical protein
MTTIGASAPPLRPNGGTPGLLPQYTQYATSTSASFKTFTPRDPATQAKYDAMSSTWEGVDSTNKAIARGDFKLDTVPTSTYTPPGKEPPPQSSDWFCVVQ